MRQLVAVVAALVVALTLGVVPGGDATHEGGHCARDLETIKIGTGNVGIDLALLNGVNHVDIPFPPCSTAGNYWVDHSTSGAQIEKHCDGKFLRAYASAGAVGQSVVVNWVSSTSSCA